MINSVNVKNNRYVIVVCVFAICDLQFIYYIEKTTLLSTSVQFSLMCTFEIPIMCTLLNTNALFF
jgi:hypothetical protein